MPIRPAIAADAPEILKLEQASAGAAHYSKQQYAEIIEQSANLNPATPPASGHDEKYHRLTLVMEEGSQLKGFLIGRFLGSEWEIENIVVSQDVRRKGLASKLLVEFLNTARQRGGKNVFLEVRESNQSARKLYAKFKFTATATRKRYYRDPPEDAVLYSLSLE